MGCAVAIVVGLVCAFLFIEFVMPLFFPVQWP